MFGKIIAANPTLDGPITNLIKRTVSDLKKDNVVSWMLRDFRNAIMQQYNPSTTNSDDIIKFLIPAYDRRLQMFVHWLSLPIPEIQRFDYGNKSHVEVSDLFEKFESEWASSRKGWVDITDELNDGDIKSVIKFPDGYCWMDLSKPYCRAEGDAMGHCGNTASYREDDTILSLRKVTRKGKSIFARPCLTFVLHRGGILGEMKGRANKKPAPQYHPYIIKLLTHRDKSGYLVTAIAGGGYEPGNNFSLDDLSDSDARDLFSVRPELEPLIMKYNRGEKIDPDFIATRIKGLIAPDISMVIGDRAIEIEFAKNWEDALDKFSNRTPKNLEEYSGIIEGGYLDGWDFDYGNRADSIDLLERAMQKESVQAMITGVVDKLVANSEEEYPETTEDIYDLLDNSNSEIIENLHRAVSDGHESGTISQVFEAFKRGVEDVEGALTSYGEDIYLQFVLKFQNPDQWMDSRVMSVFDYKDVLLILDLGTSPWDYTVEYDDGDMRVPYYGFNGYDVDYALENFEDLCGV